MNSHRMALGIFAACLLGTGCGGGENGVLVSYSPLEGAEDNDVACSDGMDNDDDGKTDCEDWGCRFLRDVQVCPRPGAERGAQCSDGLDNDGDGRTDCLDWDCAYDLWNQACDASLDRLGQARALRIGSWNLRTFPLVDKTPAAAAAQIIRLNPDVLALQEITSQQALEELQELLPGYQAISLEDLTGHSWWIQVAFLVKQERFAGVSSEVLFEDDSYIFPRPVLHLSLTWADSGSGERWEIFGVHLKAMGGEANRDRRRQAIERLASYIDQLLYQQPGAKVVLLGDFNDKLLHWGSWDVFGGLWRQVDQIVPATLAAEEADMFSYVPYEPQYCIELSSPHGVGGDPVSAQWIPAKIVRE